MRTLDENVIRAKYPEEIATKLLETDAQIGQIIAENNQLFAIKIEHLHYLRRIKIRQLRMFIWIVMQIQVLK
ncbi:MAG: hypothetical protein HFI80_09960 [Lachnospiraceae bacterium]|jgi:hypothetical protein|uniref:Uncharacterized protein n=1 Tax=Hominisplanchenecus murintestinalis TaxID=2941517 RepID=A0AC61QX85_9FIRM|nr:hypothetical protein [Lachnospiraceae bacterium]MCI9661844.1 hypothetical protein [Lachnospiraceae bacterium]TGX96736.1 hypothetical protein E5357_15110 [Hominisplanchenecus murintestinalis]